MSGPHLVEQASEVAPNAASTAHPAEDAAASLRAAALLTLKSKRRKLTSSSDTPPIPRPFVPAPPSIELDYGSEEPFVGQPSESPVPTVQSVRDVASEQEPMNVDDDQAREEGEISDSETAPPTPKDKPQPTSPNVLEQEKAAAQMPPPPLKPKIEPMSPSLSLAVPGALVFAPEVNAVSTVVDGNHIRPGLTLTQAQYDLAKDTILDLLGWGVPPEYLVDSGLSREIIFYVFIELNLRLPKNLNVTGLMPYMPQSAAANSPEPANIPPQHQQTDSTASSLSATAPPFVPNASNGNDSTPSLTDMEQQRKAELLARKAVMASRKSRPRKSTSAASSPSAGPVASGGGASQAVPTNTVDDFLNSIGPVGSSSKETSPSTSATKPPPSPAFSIDAMDVDDEVPGLSGGLTTDYTPLARPMPTTRSPSASNMLSPKSPALPSSVISARSDRLASVLPSTTNSSNGTLSYGNDDDMDTVPGLFQTRSSWDDSASAGGRKGTKRPLAMDFVDMDPGPSRSQVRTDNYRPPVRRKTTGFAGITQRRCIIDLSDSEDEADEANLQDIPSEAESRGPKASTPRASVAPTPRVSTPTTPLATPAALLEKEEQIRRMRELIAQREESRLKKLALASRGNALLDVQMNGSVAIKQEEEDSASSQSLDPSRSSSLSTPEAPSGRGSQSQDERTVLSNLLPRETNGDATVVDSDDTGEQSESSEVDVVGSCPETSAQVDANDNVDDEQTPDETPVFVTYRSLLDSHPLLRAHSLQDSAPLPSSATVAGSSLDANSAAEIDLKPLKKVAVLKYLSDPQGRVCQYDMGGECRDKDCENIHLSRLSAVEPSGTSVTALPHTRTRRNSCAPRYRLPSDTARKSS
ncbi:hypothetical protein V8D89_006967 [Ganoderma adspersum]